MGRIGDLGRRGLVALAVALGWSFALWFAAFTVPVYSSTSASSDGTTAAGSATLVGENGLSAVIVVSVPLVLSLLVALSLAFVRWPAGHVVAWALTVLFGLFNLLAMLSVGTFLVPVTVALVFACVTSREPQPARAS